MANDELEGNTLTVYAYVVHAAKPVGTRDVTRGANLSSTSVAPRHLQKLEEMGLIEKNEYGDYILKEKTNINGHVWVGNKFRATIDVLLLLFFRGFCSRDDNNIGKRPTKGLCGQISFYFLTGMTGVAMALFSLEGIALYRKLNPKHVERGNKVG